MNKSKINSPDRIAIFEVGVILALFAVNLFLRSGYTTYFQIEHKPDFDDEKGFVYRPAPEQEKLEPQKTPEIIQAAYIPDAPITIVPDFMVTPKSAIQTMAKTIGKIAPLNIITPKNTAKPSNNVVSFPEEMPGYPGGFEEFNKYVQKDLDTEEHWFEQEDVLLVTLQFEISETGKIVDIKVVDCNIDGFGLEQEAIRVFRNSPPWIPGKQNGKPVRTKYYYSVRIQ